MLRRLIEDHTTQYWIGMTDVEDDGKFHLLDGDAYDPSDINQQALYYWYPGQPDRQPSLNVDENCGLIWSHITTHAYGIGNWFCKDKILDDKPIKGICEICESWKL